MQKIGFIASYKTTEQYLPVIDNIKDFKFSGIFDPSINYSNDNQEEIPGIFTSLDELFNSVDVICFSEDYGNKEIITEAIKNVKHIFLPFPDYLDKDETEKLVKLAYEAGVKIQISLNEFYYKIYAEASKYVNNPIFVDARIVNNLHRKKQIYGSLEKINYDILIILNLINCDIKRISTLNFPVFDDWPQIINLRIEFNNGSVANFTSDTISEGREHKYLVYQNGSYIKFDLLKQAAELAKLVIPDNLSSDNLFKPDEIELDRNIGFTRIKFSEYRSLYEELKSFARCIVDDLALTISLDDYLLSCELIQNITNKIINSSNSQI